MGNKSKYGQLQPPFSMLYLYRQPLHKARAVCQWREFTRNQQCALKKTCSEMAAQQRAAKAAGLKAQRDQVRAEKKRKVAADKKKRAEEKAAEHQDLIHPRYITLANHLMALSTVALPAHQ